MNPQKLALIVESPLQRVTFGIDSLQGGEKSKPSSPIGVPGIKLFKDVVIPLAKKWEGTPKQIRINAVYTGDEERVLSVVRAAYEHGIVVNIIEVNGVMGTTYQTREAYLDLLNKIANIFNLDPKYDPSLNQVYLYEKSADESTPVKFFQDHCADLDCGNCRKIHMRVIPTPEGFAAVPCFLQAQGDVIPLATDGVIDSDKFAQAIPYLGLGPNWKNVKRRNS